MHGSNGFEVVHIEGGGCVTSMIDTGVFPERWAIFSYIHSLLSLSPSLRTIYVNITYIFHILSLYPLVFPYLDPPFCPLYLFTLLSLPSITIYI